MPPRGMKHWCKYCKKSFPSGRSLGGHMAMHRKRLKKQPSSTPALSSADGGACRYGLREKRHKTWLMCDSSDDEYLTLLPKTECQLCFKVFASSDALSIHMRVHTHHQQTMVANKVEESTEGKGCGLRDFTVSTPVVLTYGDQEVGAARILLMLSRHSDMCLASVERCNDDYERDSNSVYHVQQSESQSGDDEPMKPENCSSDGRMKFSSSSNVLKATSIHKCKLCSRFFTSGNALGGHQKFHKFHGHRKVQSIPNSAVAETGHLVEEDNRSLSLNPSSSSSDRNYSGTIGKSELNLWLDASSILSE